MPASYANAYTASKFSLRGNSETLDAELSCQSNVRVCEVYPTFVGTPGVSCGANRSNGQVRPALPVVDPRTVANALVGLATRSRPITYIGAPERLGVVAHALSPGQEVRSMKWLTAKSLQRAWAARGPHGNLFERLRVSAVDGGFRSTQAIKPAAMALAGARARRQRREA